MEILSIEERFKNIEHNINVIKSKIAAAAIESGRKPEDVKLMAVTKTVEPLFINHAIECGIDLIGENKVQEFLSKKPYLKLDNCKAHLIGHLQTNKVKQIITEVDMIQSVDSLKIAKEIAKQSAKKGITTDVLLEINIGDEESKTGFSKSEFMENLYQIAEIPELKVKGLMTIPPICDNNTILCEFFENIFGISARSGGKLYLNGKEIGNHTSREAKKNGFAFVTEERRSTGIFGILNITENTTISSLPRFLSGKTLINDRKRSEKTAEIIKRLSIKTASQKTQIRTLSGGNQQKVIFGRWLLTEPEILLLDEPTRGIDVGAKYEIYQLMEELAARGKSILVISSELPELLGVCHRIYVMSGGEITGELTAEKATQEEIMTLAAKNV